MKYKEELTELLAEILEENGEEIEITEETSLIGNVGTEYIGLSSIDYVEFLAAVEDEFGIVYEFDTRINTVGELVNYIDKKRGK